MEIENMKKIIVREVYTVDTISKTNNTAWGILIDLLEKNKDEDILFDFKGIQVIEPWNNDTFKKFLSYDNAYMKLYSSAKTVQTINFACKLGGMKTDRFINENIVAAPKISKEELMVRKMATELQKYFIENDGTAILEIYKRYDQIGSINTVDYIEAAILMYSNDNGIKNIILDTNNIFIQQNILELIADTIGRAYSKGIVLNVMSKDKDVMNKIGLYQHLASGGSINAEDKYKIAKDSIPKNMVGMLTKYKKSKSVDEFGRYGSGEAISCRVALFNGFCKNRNGVVCLRFTSYNGNTFYTQEHWALENDGETLEKMESEVLTIPIDEVGIIDKYLGSKYHFTNPIQYEEKDSTTMYGVGKDGNIETYSITIPVRIKQVLDDWNIEYDESSLIHAISETERLIVKSNK